MDNNYYNNNNNNNTNSNSNYNNNNSNNSNNNSSNQYSDSFYSYNNQQNHGNQNNTQNDSTASQAGGYGSTQSSIYGSQSNSHGSGYGTTQNNSQSANYGSAQNYNQSAGYGSTWNNSQSYGYGNQNGNYGTYGSNPKPEKKKKERKPGGFGKQLAKCAALALVFGLVAGGVMTGVNYASGKVLGTTNAGNVQASLTTGDDSTVQPTAISSSYVATDVSDIVDEVMPSIVAITNVSQTEYQSFWGQSKTYESTSCGSGIIVSQDDNYLYIATNNHVVNGANSLTVTFNDESTVSAEVKGTDPSTDLAVIRVALSSIESDTMNNIKVATLGDSDSLKAGNSCIAIGNALGYGQSVTVGYISALNRQVSVSDSESDTSYTADLIQTDAAINPGNSGGALLNTAGEVIGINSVKYSDTSVEGIGYAIPMDTAKPIIEELITKEKVDESNSAYLGITGVDVTSDVAKTYNMPTGVYVAQVMEGAAAEQAGIQKGDIITKFDGKDVTSMEELSYNMQYYAAGTTVDVVIERSSNGQYEEQTISVTLGKKN